MKYHTPKSEDEILPNKLGLKDPEKIAEEEYRGFLRAEIKFKSELNEISQFNWELRCSIHKTAFSHLYEFAGQLRQVNMSKGGFMFPAAKFLPSAIEEFEKEFLKPIPDSFENYEELIELVAPLHAELLFIHPFREGNGRTARLFADLIAMKSGFGRFNFEKITEKNMPEYIAAVQAAADKNYVSMTRLFRSLKKLEPFLNSRTTSRRICSALCFEIFIPSIRNEALWDFMALREMVSIFFFLKADFIF